MHINHAYSDAAVKKDHVNFTFFDVIILCPTMQSDAFAEQLHTCLGRAIGRQSLVVPQNAVNISDRMRAVISNPLIISQDDPA